MSFLSSFRSAAASAAAAAVASVDAIREEWSTTLFEQPEDLEFSDSIYQEIEHADVTLSLGENGLSETHSESSSDEDDSHSEASERSVIHLDSTDMSYTADNYLASDGGEVIKTKDELSVITSGQSQHQDDPPGTGSNLGLSRPQISLTAEVHNNEPTDTDDIPSNQTPTSEMSTRRSNSVAEQTSLEDSQESGVDLTQLLNTIQDRTVIGSKEGDSLPSGLPSAIAYHPDESDLHIVDEEVSLSPPLPEAYLRHMKAKEEILKKRDEMRADFQLLAEQYEVANAGMLQEQSYMIKDVGKTQKKRKGKGPNINAAALENAEPTVPKPVIHQNLVKTPDVQKIQLLDETPVAVGWLENLTHTLFQGSAAPKEQDAPDILEPPTPKHTNRSKRPGETVKSREVEKIKPAADTESLQAIKPVKSKAAGQANGLPLKKTTNQDKKSEDQIKKDAKMAKKHQKQEAKKRQIQEDKETARRIRDEEDIAKKHQIEIDAEMAEKLAMADQRIIDLENAHKRRDKEEEKRKLREEAQKKKEDDDRKTREKVAEDKRLHDEEDIRKKGDQKKREKKAHRKQEQGSLEKESRGIYSEEDRNMQEKEALDEEAEQNSEESDDEDSELSSDEESQAVFSHIEKLTKESQDLDMEEISLHKEDRDDRRRKRKERRLEEANKKVQKLENELRAKRGRVQKVKDLRLETHEVHVDSDEIDLGTEDTIINTEGVYQFRPGDNRNSTPYPNRTKRDFRDGSQSSARGGDRTFDINSAKNSDVAPPKAVRSTFTQLEKTLLTEGGVPEAEQKVFDEEKLEEQQIPENTSTVVVHLSISKDDAPDFSGNIADYMDWKVSFQSVMQRFPEHDQLETLRKKLGANRSLIQACSGRSGTALNKAWRLLEEEFGDRELLTQELAAQLRRQLVPYSTNEKFVDTLRLVRDKFDRLLKADGSSVVSTNRDYLNELLQSMPKFLGNRICRDGAKKKIKMTFNDVLKEAEEEVKCLKEQDRRLGPVKRWDNSRGRGAGPLGRGRGNINALSTDSLGEESEYQEDWEEEEDPSAFVNALQGGSRGRGGGSSGVGRGRGFSSRGGTSGASQNYGSGSKPNPLMQMNNPYAKCMVCDTDDHKTIDCKVIPAKEPHFLRELIQARRICVLCGGRNHISKFCSLHLVLENVSLPWRCEKLECLPTPHAVVFCSVYKRT